MAFETVVIVAGRILLVLAAAGVLYQAAAAVLAALALRRAPLAGNPAAPSVTILKPLHGAEPRLAENLASFLRQDHGGAVQLVCGVQRGSDPAVAVVEQLRRDWPATDIALVIDATLHGRNAKIGNLANMMAAARHDVLVMSDSDIAVPDDYLARIAAALAAPGVGAVTCLYHGRGDAGGWSRLAAMGVSYGFLPGVIIGRALGLASPCMGSTIALRRATLAEIGGLSAFADVLADDHAIGAAVRRLGLSVAIPGFPVAHSGAETSLGALVRHELRWNVTIRCLDPLGFIGHGLVNPLPLALLALAALGPAPAALSVLAAALASRWLLAASIDRATGERAGPYLWLPLRDCLTFGLFLASFLVQSVDWRGARLRIARDGRITAS